MYKKQIAVISANFGMYDDLPSNIKKLLIDYNYFDWYYFMDIPKLNKKIINGWTFIYSNDHKNTQHIRHIHNNKNMMYAKYYKCQSNNIKILNKYEYIIWMDASIEITNKIFIYDILNLINKNNDFYIFEHAQRQDIRNEYIISTSINKYNNQDMLGQINFYYSNGFKDNILYECGFFIYKQNSIVNKLFNDWWYQILKFSYQDQLSFPYVVFQNKIKPYLLNEPNFIKRSNNGSIWNNKLIGYVKCHKRNTKIQHRNKKTKKAINK